MNALERFVNRTLEEKTETHKKKRNNIIKCIFTFLFCLGTIPLFGFFISYMKKLPIGYSVAILNYICYCMMIIGLLLGIAFLIKSDE